MMNILLAFCASIPTYPSTVYPRISEGARTKLTWICEITDITIPYINSNTRNDYLRHSVVHIKKP